MTIHLGDAALARLDPEHDALCDAAGVPITGRATWLRAVLSSDPATTPVYVELTDPASATRRAGLALGLRRGRLLSRVEAPGPGVTDSHWFPARDEAAAAALARELADFLSSLGRWQLQVDSAPPDDRCLAELRRLLPRHRLSPGDGMPRMCFDGERVMRRYLSKNARHQARRAERNAAERGDPSWELVGESERLRALLPTLMRVHAARDVALGRVSDFAETRRRQTYERLVLDHAARGEIQVLVFWVGAEVASYGLQFRERGALRIWDARMNPDFSDLAVGRVCAVEMVRQALADPDIRELDWMRGEEPYKVSYSNDVVPTVDLWAWSSRAARLPRAGYEAARAVKRRSGLLTSAWRRLGSRRRGGAAAL